MGSRILATRTLLVVGAKKCRSNLGSLPTDVLVFLLVVLFCFPNYIFAQDSYKEDIIYLKNGKIIKGEIIKINYWNSGKIKDLDIIDGTPVLDIKPYIPEFDSQDIIKRGWLENNVSKLPTSKDDGRFTK